MQIPSITSGRKTQIYTYPACHEQKNKAYPAQETADMFQLNGQAENSS